MQRASLFLLFFISGVPALIYQVVWQRSLFTLYGVNIESVTTVVSAFMLGLGLGSFVGGAISKRPGVPILKVFAGFEFGIALFGLLSLTYFNWVASFTAHLSPLGLVVVAFLLVVVPTTLMGATLPLLTKYLVQLSGSVGRSVGMLYFVNTLGSAFACFLAAIVAMPYLGKLGSIQLAASLNVLVGLGVLLLEARVGPSTDIDGLRHPPRNSSHLPLSASVAICIAALGGFISLAYEIVWFRMYSFATGGRAQTFALLLGCYLIGIALGSFVINWLCKKQAPALSKSGVATLAIILFVASVACFLVVPLLARWAIPISTTLLLFPFIIVPAALLGSVFPLLCHLSTPPDSMSGRRVSLLYVANIVGGTFGAFATGFIAMDVFPLQRVVLGLLLFGIIISMCVMLVSRLSIARVALFQAFSVSVAILSVVGEPALFDRFFERLQRQSPSQGIDRFADVVETKSGVITAAVDGTVWGGGIYDGRFNTSLMHDTNGIARIYAIDALHPHPRSVLLVGLGSGSWAEVLANNQNLEHLTVIEINSGYRKLIGRYSEVAGVLTNPKVDIIIDDGRRWLIANPDKKFDAIVMNTTYSWRDNASNVLSREFLEIVRQHLNVGGVAYYNPTGSAEVYSTALSVFTSAISAWGFLAVSDGPMIFDRERWRHSLMNYRMHGRAVLDVSIPEEQQQLEQLVNSRSISFTNSLRELYGSAPIITDDNMGVEWRR